MFHILWDSYDKKKRQKVNMLASMWQNWNPHILFIGMENSAATLVKQLGSSKKCLTWSYHLTQQFHLLVYENVCPLKSLYMNVHSNIMQNRDKWKPFKYPSTDEWLYKSGITIQWNII